jgi:molecular chaperone DnaK (HSP70)
VTPRNGICTLVEQDLVSPYDEVEQPVSGRPVLGIDLGTTYSCVAHLDDTGRAVVVPNSESESTSPSVVY